MDAFLGNDSQQSANLSANLSSNLSSPSLNSGFANSGFGNAGINVQGTQLPKNLKITSWILFFVSIVFSILLI